MGCDIHMMAEVRLKRFKKDSPYYNQWHAVGRQFKTGRVTKEPPMMWSAREDGEFEAYETNTRYSIHPYEDRNYSIFALLAGVRNYSDIKPLSKPKGLPKDVSEYFKAYSDHWDSDGHSHNYLSYKQLVSGLDLIHEQKLGDETLSDYQTLLHNLQGLYWQFPGVKDVRIVFFFDN